MKIYNREMHKLNGLKRTEIRSSVLSVVTMFAFVVMMLLYTSCNSKDTEDSMQTGYDVSTDVAVNGFKLKADSRILSGLDSVFFSIDLEQGLIYNADSLPKGTPLRGLIPVISYNSEVSSAKITMTGGKYHDGVIDYKKNPTDSVDFSGRVVLTLVAQDGETTRDYLLKVNVHKMEPDSLWWDEMAVAALPSRFAATPRVQRTVQLENRAVTLLQEADGTYTLSTTSDVAAADWNKTALSFEFEPDVRSLSAATDKLYILSKDGLLYSSTDGLQWQNTGMTGWNNIIGVYENRLLGMRLGSGNYTFAEYPVGGIDGESVPADFPVEGRTGFCCYSNKWSSVPMGIFVGGRKADGSASGHAWGFDGKKWADISAHPAGTIVGATLIPYFVYRKTSTMWVHTEYSIWLLVGGRMADGTMNRETYISYDNGVNWYVAPELLRLPSYIPLMTNADNVVMDTPMNGSFRPEGWSKMPAENLMPWYRVNYDTSGYNVSWNCPYIYIFGGVGESGDLHNTIWKGVLNRLTFVPVM